MEAEWQVHGVERVAVVAGPRRKVLLRNLGDDDRVAGRRGLVDDRPESPPGVVDVRVSEVMDMLLAHPIGAEPRPRPVDCARWVVAESRILHHPGGDIDPEAVDTTAEPEPGHIVHCFADGRIPPVQVRLLTEERVEVVLAGALVVLPGRTAEQAEPVVREGAVRPGVAPEVPIPAGVRQGRARLLEPGVSVGRVIGHVVNDDTELPPMSFVDEPVEGRERAEQRVDVLVIGDVVAEVGHRRSIERGEPEPLDAQPLEVLEPTRDPIEIAGSVAVGILEAPGVDLIQRSAAPPRSSSHPSPRARCGPGWPGSADRGARALTTRHVTDFG